MGKQKEKSDQNWRAVISEEEFFENSSGL